MNDMTVPTGAAAPERAAELRCTVRPLWEHVAEVGAPMAESAAEAPWRVATDEAVSRRPGSPSSATCRTTPIGSPILEERSMERSSRTPASRPRSGVRPPTGRRPVVYGLLAAGTSVLAVACVPTLPAAGSPGAPVPSVSMTGSGMPSGKPSGMPTSGKSGMPTPKPTGMPSGKPSGMPTSGKSGMPMPKPTGMPTGMPAPMPTGMPTGVPTSMPTGMPTMTGSGPTPVFGNHW
ncbi:hypothetical protein ACWC9T_36440 [Kitasatospora sp. NPDC001159]